MNDIFEAFYASGMGHVQALATAHQPRACTGQGAFKNPAHVPPALSYLRTYDSEPSWLMRKTAKLVGTAVMVPSASLTLRALEFAATRIFPVLSKLSVRGTNPRVSAFWIRVGSPVPLSMLNTATLFSPPRNTGGVPAWPLLRLPTYANLPSWLNCMGPTICAGKIVSLLLAGSARVFFVNFGSGSRA